MGIFKDSGNFSSSRTPTETPRDLFQDTGNFNTVGEEISQTREILEQTRENTNFGQVLGAALTGGSRGYNFLGSMYHYIKTKWNRDFKVDRDFDISQAKDITDNVPFEYLPRFAVATSREHAEEIYKDIHRDIDADLKIASYGFSGIAAVLAASVIDIDTFLAPKLAGLKSKRRLNALRTAAHAASANAFTEALITQTDKQNDLIDVGSAALAGAVLGGVIGASRNPNILKTKVDDAVNEFTSATKNRFKNPDGMEFTVDFDNITMPDVGTF